MKKEDNIVYIKQNRCWTNSKHLAESFGKMHKDVLRKIQKQITEYPEDFRERNFSLSLYNQETGKGTIREYPMYEMTQDGFAVVAMTFTGTTAATFRAKIIEEFNRMRSELEMRGQPTLSTEELLQRALDEIKTQKEIAAKAIREKGLNYE